MAENHDAESLELELAEQIGQQRSALEQVDEALSLEPSSEELGEVDIYVKNARSRQGTKV